MELREYETMGRLESHHWWFRGTRRVILDQLSRHLPDSGSARRRPVLDLGCGTGATLIALNRRYEACGLDREASALSFCRLRGLPRLVLGDLVSLPFADRTFAAVLALDVLEHIPDDRRAVAEAARILVPGGLLLVTVPAFGWLWSEHDQALHHLRRYVKPGLHSLLSGAGLDVVRLSYYNSLLLPPIAVVRWWHRRRRGVAPRSDTPHSDVSLPLGPINALLQVPFEFERLWLRRGSLPAGVSLIACARRPLGPTRVTSQ